VAFVLVRTSEGARADATARQLSAIEEVAEVHRVVGDDCFFLKVRVADTDALGTLLDAKIRRLPTVSSTRTTIVLSTTKDRHQKSISDADSPPRDRLTAS
jgi:Lrp/AsnC family leucine-responsive transcriptional regulator